MEQIIEIYGKTFVIWALNRKGVWLPIMEYDASATDIEIFRVPLLIKVKEKKNE
jgi:hypothetical protein